MILLLHFLSSVQLQSERGGDNSNRETAISRKCGRMVQGWFKTFKNQQQPFSSSSELLDMLPVVSNAALPCLTAPSCRLLTTLHSRFTSQGWIQRRERVGTFGMGSSVAASFFLYRSRYPPPPPPSYREHSLSVWNSQSRIWRWWAGTALML